MVNIFTELYNHDHHLIPEHFYHHIKKRHTHQQSLPIVPSCEPLICFLLSLWIFLLLTFHVSGIITICGLLQLASFSQHKVRRVCPCCNTICIFSLFATKFLSKSQQLIIFQLFSRLLRSYLRPIICIIFYTHKKPSTLIRKAQRSTISSHDGCLKCQLLPKQLSIASIIQSILEGYQFII